MFIFFLNLEDSENIYSRDLPTVPTQKVSGGLYLLSVRQRCRYRDLEGYEVIVLDSKRDWTWPWWTWLILGVFILMVLTCITKAFQFYSFLVANSNSGNSSSSSVTSQKQSSRNWWDSFPVIIKHYLNRILKRFSMIKN